jgi:hypothetical protein
MAAVAIGGLLLAGLGGFGLRDQVRYLYAGVEVPGIVLAQGVDGQVRWVDYVYFDHAGHDHRGRATCNEGQWNRLALSLAIRVTYLVDRPAEHHTEFQTGWGLVAIVPLACGLVAFVLGAGAGWGRWRTACNRAAVVCRGQPALGTLTAVDVGHGRRAGVHVRYQFAGPGGEPCAGRAQIPAGFGTAWRGLQEGQPLLILVDPKHPDRTEPDLFQARADDLQRLQRP